ncbi:AraC family transcriptional regulator [Psychroserpens algicola]|uniref:AraC family transcriptional regulator n=1 Tax=Psychroserpens algicola TaxID=1719034 RepID=UPI0019545784|nr:helix-turn-helix domain-containing protein [Psychroserpens algicola]
MNFNIYNSIILAGVIQGFIFGAVVLLSKKYRSRSVFFLALLIVVYSLSNFQFYLQDIGLITYEELFSTIYMPWADITPALLFLYVTLYLYPDYKIKRKTYLVIVPFVFTLILSILYKVFVRLELKNDFLINLTSFIRDYIAYYTDLIAALLYIVVLIVLFKKIKNYSQSHNKFEVNHIKLQIQWLKITLLILFFLVLIWITLVVLDIYIEGISFYPIWLGVAFLIYWLGHIGVYKFGVDKERKQIRLKRQQKEIVVIESKSKHLIIERLKQYLINDKRFLDPSLTLEKTAEDLDLSRGHLSKTINTELGLSFKDFLNALRVEEAKSYLLDDDFSNYTLVAIGLEAGFNSKSTFNASFKKITGETPSQFKQRRIN